MAWTLRVRERANSLGALVLETGKQLVEVLYAEGFEEPFAVHESVCNRSVTGALYAGNWEGDATGVAREDSHVWTRQLVKSIEAEACIFHQDWTADLPPTLAQVVSKHNFQSRCQQTRGRERWSCTYSFCCPFCFVCRDVLDSALDLNEVQRLASELYACGGENGLHFG